LSAPDQLPDDAGLGAVNQPPLPGSSWDTGIPSAYLRERAEAWHDFDWAAQQARLNVVPQYTTVIDGQVIGGVIPI
jgi:Epoxide hydrolase N terminus